MTGVQDFSGFLWRDLPGHLLTPAEADRFGDVLRLSAGGHLRIDLARPDGSALALLAWHAAPPVFDGPEDLNGRRNHDETAFWGAYFDGTLPFPPPEGPFVLLGDANLDPLAGDGRRAAMASLLDHPALQDPAPVSPGALAAAARATRPPPATPPTGPIPTPETCARTTSCPRPIAWCWRRA